MPAPRKGKYSTFSEALNDVQAKHEELCSPSPAKPAYEGFNSPKSKQSSCASKRENSTNCADNWPNSLKHRLRRFKLSRMPTETIRDALCHLDRFSIDAAQIVCPRFRFTVEEMLSGVCLRQLDSVEMYHIGAGKWAPKGSDESISHENSTDYGYAIRYGFSLKTQVSGDGRKQEECKRAVTFQRLEDASEHLLGVIRSAAFKELTLRFLTLRDEFFVALMSVAPTIFVKALTLRDCDVSNVDAEILQHALLQFPVIESLVVGHRVSAPQISDAFLEAAVGRNGNALNSILFEHPVDDAPYRATDAGILRFLFQPTEKKVTLHLSHISLSSTFCAQLLQLALANPAENPIELNIRNFGAHEQEGIGAYQTGNAFTSVRYGADAPHGM